ncbi:MAG: cyclodeaminase/cyclohydrolase family protein, partial [Thermoanaerobaculia bacterium]
ALAGAVGASLLAMVAGLPKPRTGSEDEVSALRAAGETCASIALQLESLIDRDSEAYDGVVAAFRLPKGSDTEKAARTAAIQEAMRAATEAPLEVMRRCADALALWPIVSEKGNVNAASDAQVAREMLAAGLRGAHLNVEINLGSIKDGGYAGRVRDESASLAAKAV